MPLSDVKVRSLKPAEKSFKTSDGGGLFIAVSPNGAKHWRMNYRYGGKENVLSFGQYPTITLAEARLLRAQAHKQIADGIDPGALARAEKVRRKGLSAQELHDEESTFRAVGDRWMKLRGQKWKPSYSGRLRNRVIENLYPHLGHMHIGQIKPRDVLAAIRKIEDRGAIETGRRVLGYASNIFKFAVGESIIESDPTRDITQALATPRATQRRKHIPAIGLGKVMVEIDGYVGDPVTMLGLQLVIHTFVRTKEIRFAEWSEFKLDGEEPLWRIPKQRMKIADEAREDHLVPLTAQTVGILRKLQRITGNSRWVLPSPIHEGKKPISENTLIYALYALGYHGKATVHGFRSTASTVLNEHEFHRDWIEMQLAHVDSSIRGVYNAALYLKQRRTMMTWYSDFIDAQKVAYLKQRSTAEMFTDLV